MHIALESPNQPDALALIAELDAYQDELYPPESRHSLDLVAQTPTNLLFVIARDADVRAIGCGAIVLHQAFGELKRMYVRPGNRGQGIARKLLVMLEGEAKKAGCHLLKLETGPYQPEALAFYELAGYRRCGPYGSYRNDPMSVFMEKRLDDQ